MTSNPEDQLTAMSDEELIAEAERALAAEEERKAALLNDLAKTVEAKFEERRKERAEKELQWSESVRLYYGTAASTSKSGATSDRPFAGDSKPSRPDHNIVRTKCDIATAQLISMQFAGGDKNFDLLPALGTTADVAQRMEDTVAAQLDECKYARESRKAIEDRVIYGTAIMKGPINTSKYKTTYTPDASGVWQTGLSSDKAPSYVRVNPWYAFPDCTTSDPGSMEDFIEIHPLSRTELSKYSRHEGFSSGTIKELLKEDPKDYSASVFEQVGKGSSGSVSQIRNKYLVIEYHGPVTSEQLAALGIEPAYESIDGSTYYGEVWVCQGHVLRVELSNIENFEIPYTLCPYKEDPSSVFGIGMPMLVRDAQRVVTQAWHMVLDNTSASSGPQIVMQRDLIEPADREWELRPRKQWFMNDISAKISDAFQFFVVPNVTPQIMSVLTAAKNFGEEESGIPLLVAGLGSPQVGTDSATGLGMMQQAATVLSDLANETWDDLMTEKHVSRMAAWNMQYNPDSTLKGNFKVDVRSSSDFRNTQLYIRDMEKLSLEASQNPALGENIDMNELARSRLSMMRLPSTSIVMTPEQVQQKKQEAAASAKPDPEQLKYNLEVEAKAIERERLILDRERLEFEQTLAQRREEMEYEERRGATFARVAEAEASVIRSQNEKDVALMQLALKDEQFRTKISADLEAVRMRNETAAFLKGLEDNRKQRDQLLYEREMNIKERQGTGV